MQIAFHVAGKAVQSEIQENLTEANISFEAS